MDIVKYLVEVVKVCRSTKDIYGRTARDIASYFNYKEIVQILDDADEPVNLKYPDHRQ